MLNRILQMQLIQQENMPINLDNHTTLKVGDMVWLSKQNIKLHDTSKKLTAKFTRPFKIIEQINPVAFKLVTRAFQDPSSIPQFFTTSKSLKSNSWKNTRSI